MFNCIILFRKMKGELLIDYESASAMDDATEPLSGKPFFHLIIQKSHIINALALPVKITRILPSTKVLVMLTCGCRTWETIYCGNLTKRFDIRWKTFVADNKLKIGDACLFELMESGTTVIKFKVQILRGDFPSELLPRTDGSCSKPIVID